MKWSSLRHQQWTKNIRFTLLTFCSKEKKKSVLLWSICFSWDFFLLLLPLAPHCLHKFTRERERERVLKKEMKSKKWYGNYCWTKMCGCDSKMCCSWESWDINVWIRVECVEGKKISSGQWYCYPWCNTFCYLKG